MPEVNVEVEVYCSCGEGLCNQTTTGQTPGRGQPFFTVEACTTCLAKERDEGFQAGQDAAVEEAEKEKEREQSEDAAS
ncbi:hypothetical protein LCGC14_2098320 [marine sediment metagenome]|uniref:Uncharacterized protein n=1 Tax=marine sediment metagenome TaxID=412755 RepID=A0A0F9GNW4_9ZZZZ